MEKSIADKSAAFGDSRYDSDITQNLIKCREAFKTFAYEQSSSVQIQEVLTDNQIDHFVDVDFPPTLASIADPDEAFPFEQEIIWKRAKDFLLPTNSRRPEVISDDTHPSTIIASQILGS